MTPRTLQLKAGADARAVSRKLHAMGAWTKTLSSVDGEAVLLELQPHSRAIPTDIIASLAEVETVFGAHSGHPRVDAMKGSAVAVGDAVFGEQPVLIAGPCSVESPELVHQCAGIAKAAGATVLRGGAFKPRTSPYAYEGSGHEGLRWLREAADAHGLAVVTEVMSERKIEAVAEVADLMQIGSRNMQNFALLSAVGRAGKPVLLKRGIVATVSEWLLAAERLLVAGAPSVVLCERGIRGGDGTTRNLLDLGTVALLNRVHGLPVVVDPSHAVGRRDLIEDLSAAAMACGAAGLMIEIHPDPGSARCDGPQALSAKVLERIGAAMGLKQ